MQTITLNAHFDGKQILLDQPYELEPDQKLLVSVVETRGDEDDDWYAPSVAGLARAYGDDEPEYPTSLIKERNPLYEGK